MAHQNAHLGRRYLLKRAMGLATVTASLILGACAETTSLLSDAKVRHADASEDNAKAKTNAQSELQKATVYWGQEFAKNPNDLKSALSYARNLKAMGERQKALSVLQQASLMHSADTELAGEYGRLALDMDQVALAGKLLEVADNPTAPDWKVISARGTVLAKQGKYKDAVPYYERALTLAQNHPSLLNNLAMAYAMSGEPKRAEDLLRQASTDDTVSPKVRQNLALVLGLQGKHDEAKAIASQDLSTESAASDTSFMRSMVKAETKTAAATPAVAKPFATTVSKALESVDDAQPVAAKTAKAGGPPQLKPAALDVSSNQDAWKTNVASNQPAAAAPTSGGLRGSTH
jgi:Flp pilus assembly protein TadD